MNVKEVAQEFAGKMNLFLREVGREEWWDIEGSGKIECEHSRGFLLSSDPDTECITRIKSFPDSDATDEFFAGEHAVKPFSNFLLFNSLLEVIEHLEEISGKRFVARFE